MPKVMEAGTLPAAEMRDARELECLAERSVERLAGDWPLAPGPRKEGARWLEGPDRP
jgi:hypothetical protein